jgi:hypothetical protein
VRKEVRKGEVRKGEVRKGEVRKGEKAGIVAPVDGVGGTDSVYPESLNTSKGKHASANFVEEKQPSRKKPYSSVKGKKI